MRSGMRGAGIAALGLLGVVGLSGCADRDSPPAVPAPAPVSSTPTASASAGKPAPSTTTPLPGMPVPVSTGDSPVDAGRLRSTDDLPAVFGCPANVKPIRIPPTAQPTGATVPPAPETVVCASALADKEAVFLWYAPTPEAKLGALTDALARARYVHAGPNWVAAGQISPTLGSIGGEVYR